MSQRFRTRHSASSLLQPSPECNDFFAPAGSACAARKNSPLHHPSDWPKGSFKFHFVSHERSAVASFKIMIVAAAPKAAAHHAILKIIRALISRDATCMCQSESEVGALPRNLLPRADQPGGHAGNGPLAAPVCRGHVQINAAREIEAALDWPQSM